MFGEAGEGPGQFVFPETVIQDSQGRLYVCEYGGHDRIQRFSERGEFQLAFGGCGTRPGEFQRPSGLVCVDGRVFVCDTVNNRVQEFTEEGEFVRVTADAQTAGLYYPYDLAAGPDGSLYVAEFGAGRITRLSTSGEVLGRHGQSGHGERDLWTPWGVSVGRDGRVLIADTGNRRLVELTP
jgi:sugar lactone lactonase YvrE